MLLDVLGVNKETRKKAFEKYENTAGSHENDIQEYIKALKAIDRKNKNAIKSDEEYYKIAMRSKGLKKKHIKEISAQRIYKAFRKKFIAWNIFPIQPCKQNGTNRTPTNDEIKDGLIYLENFLNIFLENSNSEKKTIILVGSKAQKRETEIRSICGNDVKIIKIIHPSPLADRYWKNDSNNEWKDYVQVKINSEE